MISASQSGGIDVVNNGNVEHNLAVQGTNLKTAMIPAGGGATSTVRPRRGHLHGPAVPPRASGMQAMHLGAGSTTGPGRQLERRGDSASRRTTMSPKQMDAEMRPRSPPTQTAGLGGQPPTVLAVAQSSSTSPPR
jgi:hypothetical protein